MHNKNRWDQRGQYKLTREFLKFAIKVILSAAKYNKIDKKKKTYSAVFQECNKRRRGLACSQFLFELSQQYK